jgi:hypothetical protein
MSALIATYQANIASNTAHVVTINGRQWLILGLEFWPRDAVVTWADGLLTTHASKSAIIVTHECVTHTGVLSTPAFYSVSGTGINLGADINTKLVLPHSNVAFVVGGHDIPYGSKRVTTVRNDGTRCHQLFRNYQGYVAGVGGAPFLTEITIDENNNLCHLSAWSPAMETELSSGSEIFQLF